MDNEIAELPTTTGNATETTDQSESTPQCLQRKIYFLVDHLRKYHAELPVTLQTRISYELLTELAHCVLNEGIFEIVKALLELQHVTEKHLLQMRLQVENEYEIEVTEWCSKIKDPKELAHILDLLKVKQINKLKDADKKIIEVLDQKVNDQQSTLQMAGVPGFYTTQNPKEIKIQMFLLDFILRLSRLKYKPNK